MLKLTVAAFWHTLQVLSETIRLAGLFGLMFFGTAVAMFYIIDALLYICRLSRYYYEYLVYYYNEKNKPVVLINNQRHRHQYYTQSNTNQILMGREIEIAAKASDMERDSLSNRINPNLKLLRSRLKKYYTKVFNH
ncbi:hypothetical protein MOUN0_N05226 [Monosporozyma unispora]